jgi:hypothetical protein
VTAPLHCWVRVIAYDPRPPLSNRDSCPSVPGMAALGGAVILVYVRVRVVSGPASWLGIAAGAQQRRPTDTSPPNIVESAADAYDPPRRRTARSMTPTCFAESRG